MENECLEEASGITTKRAKSTRTKSTLTMIGADGLRLVVKFLIDRDHLRLAISSKLVLYDLNKAVLVMMDRPVRPHLKDLLRIPPKTLQNLYLDFDGDDNNEAETLQQLSQHHVVQGKVDFDNCGIALGFLEWFPLVTKVSLSLPRCPLNLDALIGHSKLKTFKINFGTNLEARATKDNPRITTIHLDRVIIGPWLQHFTRLTKLTLIAVILRNLDVLLEVVGGTLQYLTLSMLVDTCDMSKIPEFTQLHTLCLSDTRTTHTEAIGLCTNLHSLCLVGPSYNRFINTVVVKCPYFIPGSRLKQMFAQNVEKVPKKLRHCLELEKLSICDTTTTIQAAQIQHFAALRNYTFQNCGSINIVDVQECQLVQADGYAALNLAHQLGF